MKNIYEQYPEVMAYMAVVDGKLVFDIDERKVPPETVMIALHQILGEYMKSLAEQTPKQGE